MTILILQDESITYVLQGLEAKWVLCSIIPNKQKWKMKVIFSFLFELFSSQFKKQKKQQYLNLKLIKFYHTGKLEDVLSAL